ncbi:peptide deformylase [Amycolatopsis sp. NPDC026612]|uniref:peptide deformylase n=1 Tax=Amycolatopsis sp. NPDC026612 TaxID=3155466 RepID=UPI0034020D77
MNEANRGRQAGSRHRCGPATRRQSRAPGRFVAKYEGCLPFFDVRGQVPRPHIIRVEHAAIDGTTKITVFERGIARLVGHEVDHLHGKFYTDRMRKGLRPIRRRYTDGVRGAVVDERELDVGDAEDVGNPRGDLSVGSAPATVSG